MALTAPSFLYAGIFFAVLLAGFLTACTLVLFVTEPSDELGGDWADGDWPHLPSDLEISRCHSERKYP